MNEASLPRPDISAHRLDDETLARHFADLHPPLDRHEAAVEADRCYFCYDAPCMTACPTSIDVPLFIREIQAGNPLGAAKTILDANILGGMCARVCPTETLCEEVCVRQVAEGKPVKIGMLQRYATDHLMARGDHPFTRAAVTGKRVAVVGAGPAGLSCAHRLAMLGHDVTIYDARPKAGGLNEYGIATYKAVDDFAQAEVAFLLGIGGIAIETGKALGRDFSVADLSQEFDAVFLALGLAGVNALGIAEEDVPGMQDAVDWIAGLRQADDLAGLPIGRHVLVIGGGMTAIDAAVQAKGLGAETVTVAYRRDQAAMNASAFEQELAQTRGVSIRCNIRPVRIVTTGGSVQGVEFERTTTLGDTLVGTGETLVIAADQVFKAVGQLFVADPVGETGASVALEKGRIKVDADGRTSLAGVWAGGDCVTGGEDLTVVAVAHGKRAALDIDAALRQKPGLAASLGRALSSAVARLTPAEPS
jgi:glutamate synthase (NADPH/NADH) small chain